MRGPARVGTGATTRGGTRYVGAVRRDGVTTIVHLSDLHFGAHHADRVESLCSDVADHGPDLVVVSGDLTQRARHDQFRQARAFVDRLPGTVVTVVGNHDLPLFDLPRRLLAGTGRYRRSIGPDLDPVVARPGLVVVGLDTMPSWRWKSGHVSPRQVDLVRSALGCAPPDAWRLLVTHHPVLPAHRSGLVGRDRLVEACGQAGVAILLSGHTHRATADVVDLDRGGRPPRRALAVGAGTAISSRTRGTPNAYGVLRLGTPMAQGAVVEWEVREPDTVGWATARTARFRYTAEGMSAAPSDLA